MTYSNIKYAKTQISRLIDSIKSYRHFNNHIDEYIY